MHIFLKPEELFPRLVFVSLKIYKNIWLISILSIIDVIDYLQEMVG